MFRRIYRIAGACAAATLLFTAATSTALAAPGGATRFVDDDGKAGAKGCNGTMSVPTSIQDAIDAASEGDHIRVCPGTYYGPLEMAKNGLTVSAVKPWTAQLRVDTTTMTTNSDLIYMHDASDMKLRWMKLVVPTQAPCPDGVTPIDALLADRVEIRANHIALDGPVDGICGVRNGIRLATSPGSRVVFNRIPDFDRDGILALYSPNSRISGNSISFSHAAGIDEHTYTASGIDIFGSTQLEVLRNYVHGYSTNVDDELLIYGIRVVTIEPSELGPTVTGNHFNDVATAIGVGVDTVYSSTLGTFTFNTGTVGIRRGIILSLADHTDVGRNRFSASVLGIGVTDSSTDNDIHDNNFFGASNPDCTDDSTGSGSHGTANTWLDNLGDSSSPAGICDTAS